MLKKNKLDNTFEKSISVLYDVTNREIRIYCDGGRLYCPAIVVENNRVKLT